MERKLYIWICGLLAAAGLALAVEVLRIEDSIPPILDINGRYVSYTTTRHFYVHAILLNAFCLPIICALFAFTAHVGRQIDIVSWFYVGGFYLALWYLGWEAHHAHPAVVPNPRAITVMQPMSNPIDLLALAVAAGLGFWKWKQDWDPRIP